MLPGTRGGQGTVPLADPWVMICCRSHLRALLGGPREQREYGRLRISQVGKGEKRTRPRDPSTDACPAETRRFGQSTESLRGELPQPETLRAYRPLAIRTEPSASRQADRLCRASPESPEFGDRRQPLADDPAIAEGSRTGLSNSLDVLVLLSVGRSRLEHTWTGGPSLSSS